MGRNHGVNKHWSSPVKGGQGCPVKKEAAANKEGHPCFFHLVHPFCHWGNSTGATSSFSLSSSSSYPKPGPFRHTSSCQ